jgi:O-antigen/teichoic acid export membrane protein
MSRWPTVSNMKESLSKGHERTVKAKTNIAASIIIKGGQVIVNLILVPLTINFVNPKQYGIWLTLSSIIAWFTFLDIGLSHGLRNKIVETEVFGNNTNTRIFVSTTYAALIAIAIALFIIFFFINPFINWHDILKIQSYSAGELRQLVLLLFSFFCLQLILQNLNSILLANHDPMKVSLISLIGQTISIVIIYILSRMITGNLYILVLVLGGLPPIILFLSSLFLFKTSYSNYAPSIKMIKLKYAKELLRVGGNFFIINLGVIVLYQSDNIIITQLFGPSDVTTFNIAYKLFYAIIIIFTIFITSFCSASTDAYLKKDFTWIKTTQRKFYKIIFYLLWVTILLVLFSPMIYPFWVGNSIKIPFSISICMGIYVIIYMWHTLHVNILNGIGKIKLQLYLVLISSVANVLISIWLSKIIGLTGIIISNSFVFLVMGVILAIQCKKILNNTATKIWNR